MMIVIIIICMYSLKVCTATAVCNFHEKNFPFFSVNILLSEPYLPYIMAIRTYIHIRVMGSVRYNIFWCSIYVFYNDLASHN